MADKAATIRAAVRRAMGKGSGEFVHPLEPLRAHGLSGEQAGVAVNEALGISLSADECARIETLHDAVQVGLAHVEMARRGQGPDATNKGRRPTMTDKPEEIEEVEQTPAHPDHSEHPGKPGKPEPNFAPPGPQPPPTPPPPSPPDVGG